MNQGELISAIASKADSKHTKKDIEAILRIYLATMIDQLQAGEKITFVGFGSFEVVERAEREGRNPRSGEKMVIPARRAVRFKAGKALAEAVL
jgi:DNA-binding protein HU-beta